MGAVDDCFPVTTSRGETTLPDDAELGQFVRLQIAFAHCLRMTLRRNPQAEPLAKYLSEKDLQTVFAAQSPANRILLLMGSGWPCADVMGSCPIYYFIV